jgi:hypothetical protein
MLTNKPFRPSTTGARLSGSGTNYGLFSKYENMKEDEKYDRVSPPKKGKGGKRAVSRESQVRTSHGLLFQGCFSRVWGFRVWDLGSGRCAGMTNVVQRPCRGS